VTFDGAMYQLLNPVAVGLVSDAAQTWNGVKTFTSAPTTTATLAGTLNDGTLATTQWVKANVSGGGSYFVDFSEAAGSWAHGNPRVLTLPASWHNRGTMISADVYMLRNGRFVKTYGYPSDGYSIEIDTTGNVIITTTVPFSGRLVVSN
jgi:hypothetical protein